MPPHFFLRCLGTPELRGPGGAPIRFRTRKHLALLTFLAVERRDRHRRDRLADLLWPDARPAEGRHSLATALSSIRGKLGPRTFEANRETVRLLAPDLEVDLERLARGEILGDDLLPPLEVAGFLDEFEVTRAPEFMLWRDIVRAKWFPQIRDALILLMDRCRRTGDFIRNGAHADRLLAIDELSEEAIRSKMEACAFQGDRISAIRIYQAWKQRLREELDAEPSPLVEGMALRLRQRGYEPRGTAHVPTVPTDQWRNRAFVGRAAQYQVLYERWEETNAGRGRHALVLGDSGIGKTTLVQRLCTAAGLEGAVSSRVQCYDVERESPYAAIGTIVCRLLDHPGAGGTPPEWLAELARCTPAVGLRYPNLPSARESAGESARLRLTEAVHELASAVAEEHPVILIADDVHLADDASVAVLHLLMRRTQEQRIMIIMTARQAELGNSPHAGRLMETRESLALEAVELPPLTDEEMNEVVTTLAFTAGSDMPPAVRRALLRASAGVPMIVELLFDDWRAHGEESLALSIGAMTVDAQGQQQREVYHRIFERTFRTLSPPARAVLNLAAILGERLNQLSMYQLVDLSMAQTLAGMSELEQHRVLRDGGREMEFRNELLRAYAYLSVPSPLRRALHGLIADRLLAEEAAGVHIPGLVLAWHCFRAGRPVEAEPHLLRGSREALRKGGTFEVELALTSAMKGLTVASAEEARLLLAEALQEQGRWSESLSALATLNGATPQWEERERILELAAKSFSVTTAPDAQRCLHDVTEFLHRTTSVSMQAHAIEVMRFLAMFIGDHQAAEMAFQEALVITDSATDLSDRITAHTARGALAWFTQRCDLYSDTLHCLEALVSETRESGIIDSRVARLYNIQGCLYCVAGRYDRGLVSYMYAHDLARKLGNIRRERDSANNIMICHGRLGNYLEQQRWAEKALRLRPTPVGEWESVKISYGLALALGMQGMNDQAAQVIEAAVRDRDTGGRAWVEQAVGLMRADISFMSGAEARAFEYARLALESTCLRPLSIHYSGMVARWHSLLASRGRGFSESTEIPNALWARRNALDLLDQAEIAAARVQLIEARRVAATEERTELAERLKGLPAAVETQLRRFGAMC